MFPVIIYSKNKVDKKEKQTKEKKVLKVEPAKSKRKKKAKESLDIDISTEGNILKLPEFSTLEELSRSMNV